MRPAIFDQHLSVFVLYLDLYRIRFVRLEPGHPERDRYNGVGAEEAAAGQSCPSPAQKAFVSDDLGGIGQNEPLDFHVNISYAEIRPHYDRSASVGNVSTRLKVADFLFDDENVDKIAEHGLSVRQVRQILGNPHYVGPNRKRRRASHILIGLDNGGSCITVPIERTLDPLVWRPVTAWPCKESEQARLP